MSRRNLQCIKFVNDFKSLKGHFGKDVSEASYTVQECGKIIERKDVSAYRQSYGNSVVVDRNGDRRSLMSGSTIYFDDVEEQL